MSKSLGKRLRLHKPYYSHAFPNHNHHRNLNPRLLEYDDDYIRETVANNIRTSDEA